MNPRPITPCRALRQLIAGSGYTMVPGAYDTLTARLVEQAGFDAVYLTGGGYSRASGYPDLGLLTMVENVRFIGLTVEAVGIPVIADADTGYGNAINVIRTVREYEKSGVAGFHIEDQVAPKNAATTRARKSFPAPKWSARSRRRSIPGATPTWSLSPARTRARSRGSRPRSTGSTPISKPAPMSASSRHRRLSRNCGSSAGRYAARRWSTCSRAARRRCCGRRVAGNGVPARHLPVADPPRRDPRRPARAARDEGGRRHAPRRSRSRDVSGA